MTFLNKLPYKFIPGEPGIFVEIYLPKKADFQGTLYDTLTKGFNIENVKEHFKDLRKRPLIKSMLEKYDKIANYSDSFIDELQPVFFGYSMYEVDGVFYGGENKIYEERTQVIRLMFRPELDKLFIDKYKGNEQEISKITKQYLRTTRDKDDYLQSNCSGFEKNVIEGIDSWVKCVGLFLFGYIIYEICERIIMLCQNGNLSWDQAEEEIWVTSIWNLVINPIKFTPDDICQSD